MGGFLSAFQVFYFSGPIGTVKAGVLCEELTLFTGVWLDQNMNPGYLGSQSRVLESGYRQRLHFHAIYVMEMCVCACARVCVRACVCVM